VADRDGMRPQEHQVELPQRRILARSATVLICFVA
jgi:hypothetical protein